MRVDDRAGQPMCRADTLRHVIGRNLTQETRVQHARILVVFSTRFLVAFNTGFDTVSLHRHTWAVYSVPSAPRSWSVCATPARFPAAACMSGVTLPPPPPRPLPASLHEHLFSWFDRRAL